MNNACYVGMNVRIILHIFPCLQDILQVFCITISSSLFILLKYEFTYDLCKGKPTTLLMINDKDPNFNKKNTHVRSLFRN